MSRLRHPTEERPCTDPSPRCPPRRLPRWLALGPLAALAALPVLLAWAAGAAGLWQAQPGERLALLLGQTWLQCPWAIVLLGLPAFGCAFAALRGLAPTRLRAAGAAAGLFAGAAGAFGYAWHCPELQPPFLAVWYVGGGCCCRRRWARR